MNNTTVLIVGAGPVGLTLACEMARRNIPFRIVERAVTPPQGSRAKALQPRSLEILNDLEIAETLMPLGYTDLPYRKFNGKQFLGEAPRKIFPRNDTRYPAILLLPQYEVEGALRNKLEALGGQVEWSTALADFSETAGSITCRLEHPNWSEELTCTYLVACDGGKSTTRKKLGIPFVGETHQEEQLWVGDVEVEGLTPDAWYNWISPELPIAFALFPFKNSTRWQLQAVVPADAEGHIPPPTLEGFNALFKARTQMEGVTLKNSTWQSIYRVNIRRAERYRVGNAFIAGDAGHVHSIAGGMGMNTGIQDAYNLGWKLAAVIKGEAKDKLLDTYAEERIPIADWLLKTTSERHRTLVKATATGKGGVESMASSDNSQLNLNYRGSSLCANNTPTLTGLQAGDRAPDVQLANGTWLSEQLRGTAWKLLVTSGVSEAPAAYGKIIPATDEAITTAYGITQSIVLIRPDGHIALCADGWDAVHAYFEQFRA